MNTSQRDALRKHLRQTRRSLTHEQRRINAAALRLHAADLLSGSQHIAGYFAFDREGEMDINGVLAGCRSKGATTYAPIIVGKRLWFGAFDENTALVTNSLGIAEPVTDNITEWLATGSDKTTMDASDVARPDELRDALSMDVVLMPLVGFDSSGNRMGMGGGFYDRSLEKRKNTPAPPLLIGVAHSAQQTRNVWPEHWDVPLDMIITEKGVQRFR